jgi:hypothetical protein
MSSRDIVHQMTDEMGMNQQMLQSMQQQQLSQLGQDPMAQMQMPQPSMDFGQLSPEQQMMMMQQASQQASPQGQQYQAGPSQAQAPPEFDDSSSSSSSSSGSSNINLNELGLGVSSNRGFFDSILNYIKDPLVVIVIFILLNMGQVESLVKSLIPYAFGYGLYFTAIKALIGGLIYLAVKLVI